MTTRRVRPPKTTDQIRLSANSAKLKSGSHDTGTETTRRTARQSRSARRDVHRKKRPKSGPPGTTDRRDQHGAVPLSFDVSARGLFQKKLSVTQLEKICHRFGRSLKAGIRITQVWENETRSLRGSLRDSFEQVRSEIAIGRTVASAVADRSCFPPMFVEMVRVGEETGRLDEAFLRLADHYRNLVRTRRTFTQLITWPVLQLTAAAAVMTLLFLAFAWLESHMALFRAPDIFMLGLSPVGNLMLFWSMIAGVCAGVFIGVKGVSSGWFGRLPVWLALRIPLLGNAVKTLAISRFTWAFGTAIESGMDAKRAVRLGVRSTQNHYYMSRENSICEMVGQGHEFHTALLGAGVFPEDVLQAVQVGELTGELPESLDRLSDDYRERAEFSLRKIGQVTGFLVFVMVAAVIGMVVIVMYANYLGTLNEALNNPLGTVEQIQHGEKSSNPITAVKNEAVKNFLENNEDFKTIRSAYENLHNFNSVSPEEFLDGF